MSLCWLRSFLIWVSTGRWKPNNSVHIIFSVILNDVKYLGYKRRHWPHSIDPFILRQTILCVHPIASSFFLIKTESSPQTQTERESQTNTDNERVWRNEINHSWKSPTYRPHGPSFLHTAFTKLLSRSWHIPHTLRQHTSFSFPPTSWAAAGGLLCGLFCTQDKTDYFARSTSWF